MRRLAHQVARYGACQVSRLKDEDLAAGRVTTDVAQMHAGQDLSVAVEKLHAVVVVCKWREIVGDVARLAAHVRLQREIPLAALNEVPRALEGQLHLAFLVAAREAARVVPVQMRGDYGIDFVSADAQALQSVQHALRLTQHDLLRALLTQLVPYAGLTDDHPAVLARDQAHAGTVDHVVAIGRLLLFPQHLGHYSEHQSSVRLPVVGDQKMKLEVAHLHGALYAPRNGRGGDQDIAAHQGLRRQARPLRPRPAGLRPGGLRLLGAKRSGQDDHDPPADGHDPADERVG